MSENDPKPSSEGQIRELFSIAMHAVPGDRVQATIEKPHEFIAHVGGYFRLPLASQLALDPAALLERRIECYRRAGLKIDFPKIEIPKLPAGFTRPIPVLKGMGPNRAFDLCTNRFKTWRYTNDLDAAIVKNDRDPNGESYVIWERNRREADEEFKNRSANDLAQQNIAGIALHERLLDEWFYHDETGEHLDIENITLCSGSRSSDGSVPNVDWDSGRRTMYVNWFISFVCQSEHPYSSGGFVGILVARTLNPSVVCYLQTTDFF